MALRSQTPFEASPSSPLIPTMGIVEAGRKILVTGGAGFIGSAVVDRLTADRHRVTVVDDFSTGLRSRLDHSVGTGLVSIRAVDVRAEAFGDVCESVRPDVVVHLSAQIDVRRSVQDPLFDAEQNIIGTLNVLEHARKTGVGRIVIATSGGCIYGDTPTLPIRESFRGRPASPYGISKRVLSDYLHFYRQVHGVRGALLALSNVYGPRQSSAGEAGVVAIFLGAMLRGEAPAIFGDGSQTRDFVYVGDVAEAFASALDRGDGLFNIGTTVETSVQELWRLCAEAAGFGGEPRFLPARAGELMRNSLDNRLATRALGWSVTTSLRDGLAATADSLRSESEEARPEPLHSVHTHDEAPSLILTVPEPRSASARRR